MGSACVTHACSRSRSQPEEIQGDPFARPREREGRGKEREKGDSCANGLPRAASGPLSSSGRARARKRKEERAREKRVRKKMIGQDLRYKKRFVPLAHVLARPYGIPFPGAKNARRSRRSREDAQGVFAAGPVPNYRRKGFGLHSSSLDE